MATKLLFPHSFKLIGWILFIPACMLTVLSSVGVTMPEMNGKAFAILSNQFFGENVILGFVELNLFPTIIGICFLLGGIFVAFSKVKNEDEYISELRLSSLLWAVYVNYALLLLAFIFIYNTSFLSVMMYNMFTILIIFIIRFHFILYRTSKLSANE